MFRNHSSHPKTDHFDTDRIQQHVAAINFLAATLQIGTQKHNMGSHLAVLLNAIETFEKHRFSDYTFNKTKRAELVLHNRKMFNDFYKHQLKNSSSALIARALKHELKDYASSVKSHIAGIQQDLTSTLIEQQEAQFAQQEIDLLNKDLDLVYQEATALYLADRVANLKAVGYEDENPTSVEIDSSENEEGYDYLRLSECSINEEDFADKPFLRGSLHSEDEEYLPSSDEATSASEYYSEVELTTSEAEQSDDENNSETTPQLPRSASARFGQWIARREWARNSNSDAELTESDNEDLDTTPTQSRFSL